MRRHIPGIASLVAFVLLCAGALVEPAGAAPPKVVHWAGTHIIRTMSDANQYMRGAPRALKGVVVKRAQKLIATSDCEDPSSVGVSMYTYTTSGYADGNEYYCGGDHIFLTDYGRGRRHGGRWRIVLATQTLLTCQFDRKYKMPSSLVGNTCWDTTSGTSQPYHQA